MNNKLQRPPLSLYIHIPWCIKKCPYCDFNSHESKAIPENDYIAMLIKDLQQDNHWIAGRKLHSIFFGGGTPSLFSSESIARILGYIEQSVGFEPDIEITLEANPGTFEQEKFDGFFEAGVNRLSIGIQSFQSQQLQALGRVHDNNEALAAVAMAKRAGFTNINLDLMHGLPGQTPQQALVDLETAIGFEPQHISWYQLTIEPNTAFYREPPQLPVDELLCEIQAQGETLLTRNDYERYEVSAFGKPGRRSKHNINYWSFGDYIGIGAGAHGKFTDTDNNQILRRQKTRMPDSYLNNSAKPGFKENRVDETELPLEFMMNALRLSDGIPSDLFTARTGLQLDVIKKSTNRLIDQGLLEVTPQHIKTTKLGQRFLNSVLETFMAQSKG